MKFIFVLVLAIVCASQTEAYVSPACTYIMRLYAGKFQYEVLQISETVTKQTKIITEAQEMVDSIADEAQRSVDTQTKILSDLVTENIAKAKTHNKNITKCLTAEESSLKKIDLRAIDKCRLDSDVITKIKMSLADLNNCKNSLYMQQRACLMRNPIYPIPFRMCLDGLIGSVETKIKTVTEITKSSMDGSFEKAQACVGDKLGKLDLEVEDVRRKFSDCTHTTVTFIKPKNKVVFIV